jgi:hypothetical protein
LRSFRSLSRARTRARGTALEAAASTTFPPPDPGRHGLAELLTLVGAIRRLAYDRSLAPDDAMRRIRDRFGEYDGRFDDDDRRTSGG